MSYDCLQLAFGKIWNFMSSRVFEVLVAGRLACSLLYGMVRAKPDISIHIIVPYCCKHILEITESKFANLNCL